MRLGGRNTNAEIYRMVGWFGIYKIYLPGQSSPHAFLPSRLAARLSAPLLGSCTTLYLSWSIWSQKIWQYVCLRGMAVWDQITYTVMMSEFSCGRVGPRAHFRACGTLKSIFDMCIDISQCFKLVCGSHTAGCGDIYCKGSTFSKEYFGTVRAVVTLTSEKQSWDSFGDLIHTSLICDKKWNGRCYVGTPVKTEYLSCLSHTRKISFPFLGFVGGGIGGHAMGRGGWPELESCSSIDFWLGLQTQPQQVGSGSRLLLFALPTHWSWHFSYRIILCCPGYLSFGLFSLLPPLPWPPPFSLYYFLLFFWPKCSPRSKFIFWF